MLPTRPVTTKGFEQLPRDVAVQRRPIVCDERTSALDVSVQAQSVAVVEYIADRMAAMQAGSSASRESAPKYLPGSSTSTRSGLLAAVPRRFEGAMRSGAAVDSIWRVEPVTKIAGAPRCCMQPTPALLRGLGTTPVRCLWARAWR